MGMLEQAEATLRSWRRQHLSKGITYVRPGVGSITKGADGNQLIATQAATLFEQDNGAAIVNLRAIDWICEAADLVLKGKRIVPQPGDRVEINLDGDDGASASGSVEKFEVAGIGGEPCFVWHGRDAKSYRIHSIQIGTGVATASAASGVGTMAVGSTFVVS